MWPGCNWRFQPDARTNFTSSTGHKTVQESVICLQHSTIPSLLTRWAQCQERPVLDTKHLRPMKIYLFMKIKHVLKTHEKHGTFTQCTTSPGHLTPPTGSARSAWSKSAPIWCSKPACRGAPPKLVPEPEDEEPTHECRKELMWFNEPQSFPKLAEMHQQNLWQGASSTIWQ